MDDDKKLAPPPPPPPPLPQRPPERLIAPVPGHAAAADFVRPPEAKRPNLYPEQRAPRNGHVQQQEGKFDVCPICHDELLPADPAAVLAGVPDAIGLLAIPFPCAAHTFHLRCLSGMYALGVVDPAGHVNDAYVPRCPVCRFVPAADAFHDHLRGFRAVGWPLGLLARVVDVRPAPAPAPRDVPERRRFDPQYLNAPLAPLQRQALDMLQPGRVEILRVGPRAAERAPHMHALVALQRRDREHEVLAAVARLEGDGVLFFCDGDAERNAGFYGALTQYSDTAYGRDKYAAAQRRPTRPTVCNCAITVQQPEAELRERHVFTLCPHFRAQPVKAVVFVASAGDMTPLELFRLIDATTTKTGYIISYNFTTPCGHWPLEPAGAAEVKWEMQRNLAYRVTVGGDSAHEWRAPMAVAPQVADADTPQNRWCNGVQELTWANIRGGGAQAANIFVTTRVTAHTHAAYRNPTHRYVERMSLTAPLNDNTPLFSDAAVVDAPRRAVFTGGAVVGEAADGRFFVVPRPVLNDIRACLQGKTYTPNTFAAVCADTEAYLNARATSGMYDSKTVGWAYAVADSAPVVRHLVALGAVAVAREMIAADRIVRDNAAVLARANRLLQPDGRCTWALWLANELVMTALSSPAAFLGTLFAAYFGWYLLRSFFQAPEQCTFLYGRLVCEPLTGFARWYHWVAGPPPIREVGRGWFGCSHPLLWLPTALVANWGRAFAARIRAACTLRNAVVLFGWACAVLWVLASCWRVYAYLNPIPRPPLWRVDMQYRELAHRDAYARLPGGVWDALYDSVGAYWTAVGSTARAAGGLWRPFADVWHRFGDVFDAYWRGPERHAWFGALPAVMLVFAVLALRRLWLRERDRHVTSLDMTAAGDRGFYLTPHYAGGAPLDPHTSYRIPSVERAAPLAPIADDARECKLNPMAGRMGRGRGKYRPGCVRGRTTYITIHGYYTASAPVLFTNSQASESDALRARVLRVKTPAHPATVTDYLQFVRDSSESIYPGVRRDLEPITNAEFIRRFPPCKAQPLAQAAARLDRQEPVALERVQPMLKVEAGAPTVGFLCHHKAGRIISSCTPDRNLLVGPTCVVAKNELCRVWSPHSGSVVIAAVGMTAEQIGDAVTEAHRRAPIIWEGDFAKYETCRKRYTFEPWYDFIRLCGLDRLRYGVPIVHRMRKMLELRGRSKHNIRVKAKDVLISGDGATTGSNTEFTGTALLYAWARSTGLTVDELYDAGLRIFVAGDDSLCLAPPGLELDTRWLDALGLTIELEERARIEDATFCSQRFYWAYHGRFGVVRVLRPAPKVGRLLTRFLHMVAFNALAGTKKADQAIRGAAIGMLRIASHVPVIADMMHAILRTTAGRGHTRAHVRSFAVAKTLTKYLAFPSKCAARPAPGPSPYPCGHADEPAPTALRAWFRAHAVPCFVPMALILAYLQTDGIIGQHSAIGAYCAFPLIGVNDWTVWLSYFGWSVAPAVAWAVALWQFYAVFIAPHAEEALYYIKIGPLRLFHVMVAIEFYQNRATALHVAATTPHPSHAYAWWMEVLKPFFVLVAHLLRQGNFAHRVRQHRMWNVFALFTCWRGGAYLYLPFAAYDFWRRGRGCSGAPRNRHYWFFLASVVFVAWLTHTTAPAADGAPQVAN